MPSAPTFVRGPQPEYSGWKEIAKAAGTTERTARRWARRATNPLPVRWRNGRVVAWWADIQAWSSGGRAIDARPRRLLLKTWPVIAAYMRVKIDTVRKWERLKVDPLPVRNLEKTEVVAAWTTELDAWLARRVEVANQSHWRGVGKSRKVGTLARGARHG